ncbi:MAG TPA: BTAD domain-containing putative transcriptional regulator [Actinoplanes sp.]
MDFRLLGRFEVVDDHGPVELGRRMTRRMLAVLLLDAGAVVPLDRLIDLLWDGEPPDTARASLHAHMSRLRARLDPDGTGRAGIRLITHPAGYLVEADRRRVDAHVFRALVRQASTGDRVTLLRRALDLWRGPLLADIASDRLRERVGGELTELRVSTMEQLAETDPNGLIGELTQWCAEYPHHERLAGHLMLAQYRAGRQAEALTTYQRLRERLDQDLGVEPGRELHDRYVAILRRDPELSPGRRAGVPAQLPPALTWFTGREDTLKLLDQLLPGQTTRPGPMIISAIAGSPGVGKTSVAVHWAHEVADRFPDGQLYVNLRGYDPAAPVTPEEALSGFLRAMGYQPAGATQSVGELSAVYRTMLAGRRMLVLLDNARSAEQVRPLLPGTGSTVVLVTSRDDLSGLVARDGARRLFLDYLPHEDAFLLFERVLQDQRPATDPEGAAELVRLCGGLPLAVRIVAERVARHPATPLSDVAAELADETRRLDAMGVPGDPAATVRGILSWSYHALSPAGARLFRRLGLHPAGDFAAAAALSLAGPDARAADLDTLLDVHLVQTTGPGRYRMHDLVRLYAAECVVADETPDQRADALRALLTWYLYATAVAARMAGPLRTHVELPAAGFAVPEFGSHDEALAWMETERANLVAAVRLAASAGMDDIVWKLTVELWDLLSLRGYSADWIGTHEIAVAAARRLADDNALAWVLNHLAAGYGVAGQPAAGNACLREALIVKRRLGDRRSEAAILYNLSKSHEEMGSLEEGMSCAREALAICQEIGHPLIEASALSGIGSVLVRLGRPAEAVPYQRRAIDVFHETGNRYGQGDGLSDLSDAYRMLGRLSDAAGCAERALSVSRQAGHRFGEARAHDALGHAALLGGDRDQARRHWQAAHDILAELGDPMSEEVRERLRSLV